ncbi:MAG TPA: hypothetical protein VMU04_05385 [Candidatus Acidoferrum sp.]|nr:hypothetical protein [Candidatus Acidoferrum sp.]
MNGQPPKARRGCFFYGCISGLVLLLVIAILGVIAFNYGKKKLSAMVNQYTDTQPMALPTVQMSSADAAKLKQRFEEFQQAMRAGRPAPPLELTADDINELIATSQGKNSLKGKFYVSFAGDRVKGELSLPLADIGWKMFRNRYLNGSGTFNVSLQHGVLFVSPQTLEVKGKPLPEMYMQSLRAVNFAAGLTNQPNTMTVLQNLESVQVKEGKLIVTPKAQPEVPNPKAEKE